MFFSWDLDDENAKSLDLIDIFGSVILLSTLWIIVAFSLLRRRNVPEELPELRTLTHIVRFRNWTSSDYDYNDDDDGGGRLTDMPTETRSTVYLHLQPYETWKQNHDWLRTAKIWGGKAKTNKKNSEIKIGRQFFYNFCVFFDAYRTFCGDILIINTLFSHSRNRSWF